MKRIITMLFLAVLFTAVTLIEVRAQEQQLSALPDELQPIAILFKQFKAMHTEVVQKTLSFNIDSEVAFKLDVSGGGFRKPSNREIRSVDQFEDSSKYEIEFKKVPLGIRLDW